MNVREKELIRLAKEHDPQAIDALLVDYSPVVFSYFLRMGLEQGVAEELAQETFRRIWKALAGFAGHASLKTWILSIGRRVAYHYFQQKKKQPQLLSLSESLDRVTELLDPSQIDPEQAFLSAERQYTLEQLLETLPAEEREVVVLHGLEELSQREVAQLMGRSLGWVNKTWHHACSRMKRKLFRVYRMNSTSEFFGEDMLPWQTQKTLVMGM